MTPRAGKWVGYGVGAVGLLLLAIGMGSQDTVTGSGMGGLAVLGVIIAIGGAVCVAIYWRCPSCGWFLPTRTFFVEHCHRCGESIDQPMFKK